MKNFISILLLITQFILAKSQVKFLNSFKLNESYTIANQIPSNSVSQMVIDKNTIWIGTSRGLASSIDTGKNWITYASIAEFVKPGIFGLEVSNDTIWTSLGYSKQKDNENIPTGSGYTYSTDGGKTWKHTEQTLDSRTDTIIDYGINKIKALPVIVPEQNVTYDVSIAQGRVWIASWASGLRYSRIDSIKWNRVVLPPDNLTSIKPSDTLNFYFDPRRNNNFLAFAVLAIDSDTIWCGTAGGVNKSTDGGISWIKFNRQNQDKPILGNWVITIKAQKHNGRMFIWTTNWKAESPEEEYGISYTSDGGATWNNLLKGIKAYDFAFKDSIVYIATENGIYRTYDYGKNFYRTSLIVDETTRQILTSSSAYTVDVLGDYVFVGTGDGLAATIDNLQTPFGTIWKIFRKYEQIGTSTKSYAYPNPFSPSNEYIRIHYSTSGRDAQVSIEIFDFGMNRVRTIIQNAFRSGQIEHDDFWEGKDDNGKDVANGVYFYRIRVNDDDPLWGKIIVLR